MGRFLQQLGARLHPLEVANKRFWHLVLRRVWRNEPLRERLDPGTVRRVLFLRYDVIGDMLTTLPAIDMVKRLNPAIEVDVLASPANRKIIGHDSNVSRIFILHRSPLAFLRELRRMRARQYDAVFACIFGTTSIGGILANLAGGSNAVKATIWRGERYSFLFNVQSEMAYRQSSYWDRMLYILPDTFAFEYDPADVRPYVAVDPESHAAARRGLERLGLSDGGFSIVNLSVRHERKQWTAEMYRAVVPALLGHAPDEQVLLIHTPEETELAEALHREYGADGRVHIYPRTGNVLEIIGVIGRSRLVVTPDTGVVHMAAATGRPVMTLYYDERSSLDWEPYRVPFRSLHSDRRPVSTIAPEMVAGKLMELLDELDGVECTKSAVEPGGG